MLGKVALVTGASSGIGRSLSKALANEGLKVIGVARSFEPIENMTRVQNWKNGTITQMRCDISKSDEIETLFKNIKKMYGGVDICINNAGMSFGSSLLDGTREQWSQMMDLNVLAVCQCSKLAVESMIERFVGGYIVNVSSVIAHNPVPPPFANFYTATKLALKYITEGLRQELLYNNPRIKVACISPGTTATNLFYNMLDKKVIDNMARRQTRLHPDDVTRSILHILSTPPTVEINDIIIRPIAHEI